MKKPWRISRPPLSPYLKESTRLADVIAAIQAMATFRYYKLTHEGWADRISSDKTQAGKWKEVFHDHPEFFRLDSSREKASLVWRRQFPKRYSVDTGAVLTQSAFDALTDREKTRFSRTPLSSTDIKALIDTAVNLHSRAMESQRDRRWWVPMSGGVGAMIGAIIGGLLKK